MTIIHSLTRQIGLNLNGLSSSLPSCKTISGSLSSLNNMLKNHSINIPNITDNNLITGAMNTGKTLLNQLVKGGMKIMLNKSLNDLIKNMDENTLNKVNDMAKNVTLPTSADTSQLSSNEVTTNLMNQMLNNPEMTKLATETMKEMLKDQNTVNNLTSVLSNLLKNK